VGNGLHDIIISVNKFTAFNREAGDHIVIVATDVEDPFSEEISTFEGTITGNSEPEPLGDLSLPVHLSAFSAEAGDGQVLLKWTTESEINSLGFHIHRAIRKDSANYVKITKDIINSAGTSTDTHDYSFLDCNVDNGTTYYYRLESGNIDGSFTFSESVTMTPQEGLRVGIPHHFRLFHNYPNPFNPETTIEYDLSEANSLINSK